VLISHLPVASEHQHRGSGGRIAPVGSLVCAPVPCTEAFKPLLAKVRLLFHRGEIPQLPKLDNASPQRIRTLITPQRQHRIQP
jgi:hypothetical protein